MSQTSGGRIVFCKTRNTCQHSTQPGLTIIRFGVRSEMAEGTMKAPAGLLAARSATASAVSRDAILRIG